MTFTNGTAAQTEASETDKRILAELQRRARIAALKAKDWKVTLSGGRTATVVDPDLLTERKAKAIKLAMSRMANEDPATERMVIDKVAAIDSGYVIVAGFLQEWTFEIPLPSMDNTDSLLDLTAKDFRILSDAVADLRAEVFADYSTDTPEALADPSSPLGAGGG